MGVQHFRALRKQVGRPQRNLSRWGGQACNLRVAVTRDARARGRAGCGAGHRQSSAHRRWQNCGGRPLENPFERFALIPIFAPNTLVCAVNRKKSAYLHRTYKTSLASSTDLQKDVNLLV